MKPNNPTVEDLRRIQAEADGADDFWRRMSSEFPATPVNVINDMIDVEVERLRSDAEAFAEEADVLEHTEQVAKRAGDPEGTPIGESLRKLAIAGDEDAKAILQQMSTPERQIFTETMFRAAAADPEWTVRDDNALTMKRGARHDTPEKLVAAYLKEQGDLQTYYRLEAAGLLPPHRLSGQQPGA